jgi:hypothetical protein
MSRTAEEWGRLAVSLPGWRWMPGMLTAHGRICGAGYLVFDDIDESGQPYVDCTDSTDDWPELAPDPDDPATAGCLLAMLGDRLESVDRLDDGYRVKWFLWDGICSTPKFASLGRACIAAAEALGRWPGGVA